MYDSIVVFLFTAVPYLVALSTFTCYVLIDSDNVLDAQTAFVAMTIFNLLRLPVNFVPLLISILIQCSVSLRRIEKFLNSEEKDLQVREVTAKLPCKFLPSPGRGQGGGQACHQLHRRLVFLDRITGAAGEGSPP